MPTLSIDDITVILLLTALLCLIGAIAASILFPAGSPSEPRPAVIAAAERGLHQRDQSRDAE